MKRFTFVEVFWVITIGIFTALAVISGFAKAFREAVLDSLIR